jgi:hypothetical protein
MDGAHLFARGAGGRTTAGPSTRCAALHSLRTEGGLAIVRSHPFAKKRRMDGAQMIVASLRVGEDSTVPKGEGQGATTHSCLRHPTNCVYPAMESGITAFVWMISKLRHRQFTE